MVADLHTVFAWIVVITNGIAGAWAIGAHFGERLRHNALWLFTAVAEVLLFVQVTLGVVRLQQLDREAPEFHTFYGFLTLIVVAILYGYRTQLGHVRYLLYGGGGLFIMGLAIRAMFLPAG